MASGNSQRQLVVIGASAGGIEALSVLVSTLPTPFPAPIVVAQHLEPTRESHLEEILARRSALPVRAVSGREHLENGVVHVVPPNEHAVIGEGIITLQSDPTDRSLPSVDRLLTTSATSYGENLIAVILTGTGSDGTAGARAVRQAGGTVILQDPATASNGGVSASLPPSTADIVANLERIGPLVHEILTGAQAAPAGQDDSAVRGLLDEVRDRSGIDFCCYKPATIHRRLQRRIADTSTGNVKQYIQYLRGHPEEYQRLINAFLIKVTEFMRDPDLFAYLREKIIPQLVADAAKRGNELRIWSAGCATGEEAYSLAILICEVLGKHLDDYTVRIFATDLDGEAIAFARRGVYPAGSITGLSPEIRGRYFSEESESVRVNKLIRGLTVFGVHDLAQRAPFPHIDLVLCRNVLIYFTNELQKRTLQLFAFSMRENGYLVLGRAETTSPFSELFTLHHPQQRIYQRGSGRAMIPAARLAPSDSGPKQIARQRVAATHASGGGHAQRATPRARASRESRAVDLPVGVAILRPRYDIEEINPAARSLLDIHRPAAGEDLVHLVQSADAPRLRAALDAALRGNVPPPVKDFCVTTPGGEPPRYLEIVCQPQGQEPDGDPEPAADQASSDGQPGRGKVDGVLVVIRDTTTAVTERLKLEAEQARIAAAEIELRATVARLNAETESMRADNTKLDASLRELSAALTSEKAQRSKDSEALDRYVEQIRELRSANEELVAANDRLQSSNDQYVLSNEEGQASTEELETLNEEFQATNEELETLNEEFQATIEELNTTNEDLGARGRELLELARIADAERTRLSAVLVGIGDGVLVVDQEGRTVLTNEAYGRMFQAPPEIILDEAGHTIASEQIPHRRAARGESFRMEFSLPIKDAGPRDFEAIGAPVRDQSGQLKGGVVVIRDISERSLRRLRDRFLAMTSHELRTPLVPLQGYLQMLLRSLSEDAPDSDRLRYTSNAIAQMQRVTALVDELLEATRLQTGKFQLTLAPLDLGRLVARIAQSAESVPHGRVVVVESAPEPMMIRGDASRLEQVLVNLLTSAAAHAPNAERIDVRVRRVDDEVELEVEDHGPGIPESDLSRLFWPFYQSNDAGQTSRGGLGLGLFICSEIIAAHGGRISVRSAAGRGTIFTVRLKLLAEPTEATP